MNFCQRKVLLFALSRPSYFLSLLFVLFYLEGYVKYLVERAYQVVLLLCLVSDVIVTVVSMQLCPFLLCPQDNVQFYEILNFIRKKCQTK